MKLDTFMKITTYGMLSEKRCYNEKSGDENESTICCKQLHVGSESEVNPDRQNCEPKQN